MRNYLAGIFSGALHRLYPDTEFKLQFDIPQNEGFGDLSTNIAMSLAKQTKKNPREVAGAIISALDFDTSLIAKVDIAGPGFINIHFSSGYVCGIVETVLREDSHFGKSKKIRRQARKC